MKLTPLLCLFTALAAPLAAQDTVSSYASAEAKAHVGEYARITGPVSEVYITAKGDTFIRFDEPYPDSDFSAVIYAGDHEKFGDVTQLRGHTISVTGTIRKYHDKPEVILKRRNQLETGDAKK